MHLSRISFSLSFCLQGSYSYKFFWAATSHKFGIPPALFFFRHSQTYTHISVGCDLFVTPPHLRISFIATSNKHTIDAFHERFIMFHCALFLLSPLSAGVSNVTTVRPNTQAVLHCGSIWKCTSITFSTFVIYAVVALNANTHWISMFKRICKYVGTCAHIVRTLF